MKPPRPCWKCGQSVEFKPTPDAPLGAWVDVGTINHHRCNAQANPLSAFTTEQLLQELVRREFVLRQKQHNTTAQQKGKAAK